MVDWNVLKKLMDSFPGSYVNGNFEFIAGPEANQYFLLENCTTERDVKAKVIEWLSRAACKTQPYDSPAKNDKFNKEMRDCINNYLGTNFTVEDFVQMYQRYGNAVRHNETLEFVDSLKPVSKDNKKTYDLGHFENAQENFWDTAYAEISAGRKETHWIWYIFPQLKGFGVSKVSEDYGISGIEEARQYLSNEYLHNNLVAITRALLNCGKDDIHDIVSYPDDLKIRSCMTLFYCAADDPEDKELFSDVIYKYYGGVFDDTTIRKLREEKL